MRCYHLSNHYLTGGMHCGIQSAHTQHELMLKYSMRTSCAAQSYLEWAENHKTIIVLNGGMNSDLLEWEQFLENNPNNPYAFASFRESEEALGKILTNIGIVLPERIYKYSRAIKRMFDTHTVGTVIDGTTCCFYYDVNDEQFKLRYGGDDQEVWTYTEFDVDLIKRLAPLSLA